MRRFVTIALSLTLVLGLTGVRHLLAQDEKKEAPKPEPAKTEAKPESKPAEAKTETPKTETPKAEPAKTETEAPLPTIPPEVEAKLEAARHAVAEAIVAAQDAGLVDTTIDPPPILDILITGRATDARGLKAKTGVSPEVFGAWFTGYGKSTMKDVTPQKDVRIIQPSKGLTEWYTQRANILNRHIEAVRKAKGDTAKKEEPKKEDVKKEEPKKDEVKKEEPKKDEKKDEAKKEEPKKDEPKADDAKKEEKKDEAKPDEKKEEPKKDEPKSL